jgi:hypothetical protein
MIEKAIIVLEKGIPNEKTMNRIILIDRRNNYTEHDGYITHIAMVTALGYSNRKVIEVRLDSGYSLRFLGLATEIKEGKEELVESRFKEELVKWRKEDGTTQGLRDIVDHFLEEKQ